MARLIPFLENEKQDYIFERMESEISKHKRDNPDITVKRYGIGDVTLPLAPIVTDALFNASLEMGRGYSFRGYSPVCGYPFLKDAIQGYLYTLGAEIARDDIFVTSGSKETLYLLLSIFTPTEILVQSPSYPALHDITSMLSHKILCALCTPDNLYLPLPDYKTTPSLIYIASPSNPTGAAYTEEELSIWVDFAISKGAIIIYDNAYEIFADDNIPRSIYTVKGADQCAIEVSSLSKSAGFTGIRCGWMIIPSALSHIKRAFHRFLSSSFNGVSYITQRGAEAALSPDGVSYSLSCAKKYKSRAYELCQKLSSVGADFYYSGSSPYIWLKTKSSLDGFQFFKDTLTRYGVALTPGEAFGIGGRGYARISAFSL